jgi:hypothetical protein
MKVTSRKARENRARVNSEVEALKQFVEGFILSADDTLQNETRPIDIVRALLPNRVINGSDYLEAINNQADEELMAAVQLAKVWQDARQAARKFYQFTGRNNSMVVRFKALLGIAPKSKR